MGLNSEPKFEKIPTLLRDVKPIEHGGLFIKQRRDIRDVVEMPLISACEELYDKNILTLQSSANQKDIKSGECWVTLHFDSMSDENKKTAQAFATSYKYMCEKHIKLSIVVNGTTTIKQIQEQFQEIIHHFHVQPMLWVPKYTLEKVRKIYGDSDNKLQIADFPDYFYDDSSRTFFESKEHFRKAKESGAI
jgi:hypothetical protein